LLWVGKRVNLMSKLRWIEIAGSIPS